MKLIIIPVSDLETLQCDKIAKYIHSVIGEPVQVNIVTLNIPKVKENVTPLPEGYLDFISLFPKDCSEIKAIKMVIDLHNSGNLNNELVCFMQSMKTKTPEYEVLRDLHLTFLPKIFKELFS